MKKLITIALFIWVVKANAANNYYLKETGSDGLNGLSDANAWVSLSKIFAATLAANDTINLKRGSTFLGTIMMNRNNIVFRAYGTGAKPIVTGLVTITGWVNLGGNIWEAPTSGFSALVKPDNNLVLRDGELMRIGRTPNFTGYGNSYYYNTARTSTTMTGPALSSTTNWTGAEGVFRNVRWEHTRKTITAHSGGVITFASMSSGTPGLGSGYFFQRDSRTLDQDGEWWQDGVNNKLRMYFGNNNPNAYTIQAAIYDTLFTNMTGPSAGYFNGIIMSDISFIGAGEFAIYVRSGTLHRFKNIDIRNTGWDAMAVVSSFDISIDSSTVKSCLGGGILFSNASNTTLSSITNCTIDSIQLFAGMETSEQNIVGGGILNRAGQNVYVTNNSVQNAGYVGINWYGNDAYIKYNYINKFCSIRDDGAGIYTSENTDTAAYVTRFNRNVISNIIINGIGAPYGSNDTTDGNANGIYVDDGTYNVLIDSNTVSNLADAGIHGNNNRYITATNNTVFKSGKGYSTNRFGSVNPNIPGRTVIGMRITNNIFYPHRFIYGNYQRNIESSTLLAAQQAIGIVDSNYYSLRTGTDTSLLETSTLYDGTSYLQTVRNITYLKSTVGWEAVTPSRFISDNTSGALYTNPSNNVITVNFTGLSKKDVFGNGYNNSVTVPAWRSIILLDNGSVTNIRTYFLKRKK